MRSRNIKPGFFTNEELSEVDIQTRMFFIGLWCYADREGRFELKYKKMKAAIYPYDNFDAKEAIQKLVSLNFIVCSDTVGQIVNFTKHQVIHPNETKSTFPEVIKTNNDDIELNQCNDNEVTCNDNEVTCNDNEATCNDNEVTCNDNEATCNDNEVTCNDNGIEYPSSISESLNLYKNSSSEADAVRLSDFLFQNIRKNNPKYKTPNMQSWAKHIDLMIRIDNRTAEEIREMITWCQQDTFWKCNILSTKTLREKFDQLTIKKNATTATDRGSRFKVYRAGDNTAFADPVYDDDE